MPRKTAAEQTTDTLLDSLTKVRTPKTVDPITVARKELDAKLDGYIAEIAQDVVSITEGTADEGVQKEALTSLRSLRARLKRAVKNIGDDAVEAKLASVTALLSGEDTEAGQDALADAPAAE